METIAKAIYALIEALWDFADWLLDLLLWFPKKLWQEICDGAAAALSAIPVPDFVTTAQGAFGSIPPSVVFFAQKFAFSEGIAMVLAAYALRFLIRRIPLIG